MEVTMSEYHSIVYDRGGYCTTCGQISYGHKQSANKDECELCGNHSVVGFEKAVAIGLVKVI
jgi:hypothetical protein